MSNIFYTLNVDKKIYKQKNSKRNLTKYENIRRWFYKTSSLFENIPKRKGTYQINTKVR